MSIWLALRDFPFDYLPVSFPSGSAALLSKDFFSLTLTDGMSQTSICTAALSRA
jgi:hypothetical protein